MAPKRETKPRKAAKASAPRRPASRTAAQTPPAPPAPPPAPVPAHARSSFGGGLVAAAVVLALAAALVVGLRLRSGDDAFEPKPGAPTAASVAELREFATPNRPVYWVGPPTAGRLELTRTSDGAVYVRYLTAGATLGDEAPIYTTIATYPQPNAYATLQRAARTSGAERRRAGNGALALWRQDRPKSVYLAWRRGDRLIEIYDPSPSHARSLALSGRVRLVR